MHKIIRRPEIAGENTIQARLTIKYNTLEHDYTPCKNGEPETQEEQYFSEKALLTLERGEHPLNAIISQEEAFYARMDVIKAKSDAGYLSQHYKRTGRLPNQATPHHRRWSSSPAQDPRHPPKIQPGATAFKHENRKLAFNRTPTEIISAFQNAEISLENIQRQAQTAQSQASENPTQENLDRASDLKAISNLCEDALAAHIVKQASKQEEPFSRPGDICYD